MAGCAMAPGRMGLQGSRGSILCGCQSRLRLRTHPRCLQRYLDIPRTPEMPGEIESALLAYL